MLQPSNISCCTQYPSDDRSFFKWLRQFAKARSTALSGILRVFRDLYPCRHSLAYWARRWRRSCKRKGSYIALRPPPLYWCLSRIEKYIYSVLWLDIKIIPLGQSSFHVKNRCLHRYHVCKIPRLRPLSHRAGEKVRTQSCLPIFASCMLC